MGLGILHEDAVNAMCIKNGANKTNFYDWLIQKTCEMYYSLNYETLDEKDMLSEFDYIKSYLNNERKNAFVVPDYFYVSDSRIIIGEVFVTNKVNNRKISILGRLTAFLDGMGVYTFVEVAKPLESIIYKYDAEITWLCGSIDPIELEIVSFDSLLN